LNQRYIDFIREVMRMSGKFEDNEVKDMFRSKVFDDGEDIGG
jgi:hypothetical protein